MSSVRLFAFIQKNSLFIGIVSLYIILMVSVIRWGIPNPSHPYNYQMDEWHQLEAVRGVLKHGSNNIEGAAHGPILHFILAGVYLIPFYLLKIINPFLIKSSTTELFLQERLFIILRTNTLLYGILTLVLIYKISRDYIKINPLISTMLLTITPLWFALSTYFKYDIAVTFWITLFIFCSLLYNVRPSLRRFIIVSISAGLALSSKISVMPIFPLLIITFFLFTEKPLKKISNLLWGVGIFFVTFIVCGIPDFPFHVKDYGEYLYSNIVTVPASSSNYIYGMPYPVYALTKTLPETFGTCAFMIFVSSLFLYGYLIIRRVVFRRQSRFGSIQWFLLCGFLLFLYSVLPLKLFAWGNRALVLLPFIVLLSGFIGDRILKLLPGKLPVFFLTFLFIIQFIQSFVVVSYKYHPDPREEASNWLTKNISRGTTIGIQNIPIYQGIPDITLYEYYASQSNPKLKTTYNYKVIDSKTEDLPRIIIVTSKDLNQKFTKQSDTKSLLERLRSEKYITAAEFKPDRNLYAYFGDTFAMYASGTVQVNEITIFKKGSQ